MLDFKSKLVPHTAGGSGGSRFERQDALGEFTSPSMIASQERNNVTL